VLQKEKYMKIVEFIVYQSDQLPYTVGLQAEIAKDFAKIGKQIATYDTVTKCFVIGDTKYKVREER
jgi:hypothetical protein